MTAMRVIGNVLLVEHAVGQSLKSEKVLLSLAGILRKVCLQRDLHGLAVKTVDNAGGVLAGGVIARLAVLRI